MTSLAHRLARPEILALAPFDLGPGRCSPFADRTIRLDANENPYPALADGPKAAGLSRYPEPQPAALRAAMAALYGVTPDELLVTRGGDDAIDLMIRTFCRPGLDAVSVMRPTFSAYAHFAALQGARIVEVPLDPEFDLDPEALLARARAEPDLKLAFICSPNNPTGNPVDPAAVLRLAEALPETLLVLDEAYLEFSETPSLAAAAAARDNLVILKTLSKAYGLAGARIGALVGNAALVAIAARAMPPYPLPSLSVEAALEALSPARRALHAQRIAAIKRDRDALAAALAASPLVDRVRSGGGNFLFLKVKDPDALAARLHGLGISVRFRPKAAPGGVRVTVGTPEENAALLAAFEVAAPAPASRRGEAVRATRETSIAAAVELDRPGARSIDTGIGFLDHMLDQVAAHGGFSLTLACKGDLEIDPHHSIEDVAITFGQAMSRALGPRRGIGRFGFSLPMDEAAAHVLLDLSGRPFSRFEGSFAASHVGAYPTEMTSHFFRSLADSLGAAIHVRVEGDNDHHKTEACFKALGRALRQAVAPAGEGAVPSTKGVL